MLSPRYAVGLALAVALALATQFAAVRAASATLEASPSVLARSGDQLTLKFTMVDPTELDTIWVFAGANSTAPPLGWFNVSGVEGWSRGSGDITFPVSNMRRPYSFEYRSGAAQTPIAASNAVTFTSWNEPTQIRLAFTNSSDSVSVMWVTADPVGSVAWGTSSTSLPHATPAVATTYKMTDMCTAPANTPEGFIDPGMLNTAVMQGLPPATRIYYQIRTKDQTSEVMTFMSPPKVGADVETHLFAYGDLGTTLPWDTAQEQQPPSAQTVSWMLRDIAALGDVPSSALHIGDISYARGWAFLWEYFGEMTEPVSQQLPYMVGIGNHEYDYTGQPFHPSWSDYGDDSGGECGIPYERRFAMTGAAKHRNLWYSYNHGNIHQLVFSTEHNFTVGSPQWKFIQADLAAVDRTVTPWVIVGGHRPMYSSSEGYNIGQGRHTDQIQTHMLHDIEPLLVEYKVNLCIWGHVHKYERSCGVQNFTCAENDSDLPVHLVLGSAGNVFQTLWASSLAKSPALQNAGHHVQPAWSVFRAGEFGYGRITTNATHLHFEFVGDQRGDVHDELWLHASQ